jgi:hypothetical protein
MITRDTRNLKPVDAFSNASFDASCGSVGTATDTGNPGRIIDRTALGRGYYSALVAVNATFDGASSTVGDGAAGFVGVHAYLYHSSTTCADDFDRYSTESEQGQQALFLTGNTTSTLASGYMATSTSVGTFGTFSATATGGGVGSYHASYDLTGAQQYVRVFPIVQAFASSSGGPNVHANAQIVFGAADEAPPSTTSTSPSHLT